MKLAVTDPIEEVCLHQPTEQFPSVEQLLGTISVCPLTIYIGTMGITTMLVNAERLKVEIDSQKKLAGAFRQRFSSSMAQLAGLQKDNQASATFSLMKLRACMQLCI